LRARVIAGVRGSAERVRAHASYADAAAAAPVVLVAVADRALPELARALARRLPRGARAVLHTSGAFDAEVLAPLRARGCAVGSLHPLLPLAGRSASVRGAWFAVDGDRAARAPRRALVRLLRGRELAVAPEEVLRIAYHAGATLLSNGTVALLDTAMQLFAAAGVPPRARRDALLALLEATVANVRASAPARALTGPIARGDAPTVARHLAALTALEGREPGLAGVSALYLALARRLVGTARGRPGSDAAALDGVEISLEAAERIQRERSRRRGSAQGARSRRTR
jgi:predicted short-subunit dehydrogenase-like oxidoreductase (DUF2520 family)